ncbi:hypothetical protein HMPREF1545_04326 [Oscillibacter sp. KLE 1728]|nr:hypothetical protein HMPREF1545_04326 [Oscillibacter sp. KLE 1728]ERK54854.1 hypothetical protein HMPREF1546_04295 [Oscillibacter sp. KLE 1745]
MTSSGIFFTSFLSWGFSMRNGWLQGLPAAACRRQEYPDGRL